MVEVAQSKLKENSSSVGMVKVRGLVPIIGSTPKVGATEGRALVPEMPIMPAFSAMVVQ